MYSKLIYLILALMMTAIVYGATSGGGTLPKPINPCLSISVSTIDLADRFDIKQVGSLVQKYDENGKAMTKTIRRYVLDDDGNSIYEYITMPVLEPKLKTVYTAKKGYAGLQLSNVIAQVMATKRNICNNKLNLT